MLAPVTTPSREGASSTGGGRLPSLSPPGRTAITQLLVHGPASRAELARKLGFSPATLTRTCRALEADELITESSASSEQRLGRPSQLIEANADRLHFVGIKISSGQFNLVRTDMKARVLDEQVTALRDDNAETVIATMTSAIREQCVSDPRVASVGVSIAGPASPRAELLPISPFLGWEKVALGRELEERTGLFVVVENDVRALTAAEHWFGAARGNANFAVITIGLGIGCGLVVDDRLVDGNIGASGQIGHLPVTDNGPLCERGHRGCVRSYLASTLMLAQASTVLARAVDWNELLELGRSGHPAVSRILADAGHALGVLIGTIASVTAPTTILISGESADLIPLVRQNIETAAAAAQHWTVPPVPFQVVPFTFTEWARGAAVIALQHLLISMAKVPD